MAQREDSFALSFRWLFPDRAGRRLPFRLTSDDGSKLWIDGKVVVDNDGVHPSTTVTGNVALTKGRHKVTVGYFQGGGDVVLRVQIKGPVCRGVSWAAWSGDRGRTRRAAGAGRRNPSVRMTSKCGPTWWRRARPCSSPPVASCHTLHSDGKPLASTVTRRRRSRHSRREVAWPQRRRRVSRGTVLTRHRRRAGRGTASTGPARTDARCDPGTHSDDVQLLRLPCPRQGRRPRGGDRTSFFVDHAAGDGRRGPRAAAARRRRGQAQPRLPQADPRQGVRTIGPTCTPACRASARPTSVLCAGASRHSTSWVCRRDGSAHGCRRQGEVRWPAHGRRPGVRLHQVPHLRRQQGRGRAGHRHDC